MKPHSTICFAAILIAFLLIPFAPASAKVYLVSVGITDYPGTSLDLNLPAKDAKTIANLYKKNSSVTCCQLLDAQATINNIVLAIEQTFASATTNDIVVLFYSGHGYPGGFCAYDGNIPYSKIKKAMAKSNCRNKMIFADACFSGKMRQSSTAPATTTSAATKNLNVMLFLSSRDNETSIERRGMKNGFFTTYLISALRGHADTNRDRTITANELFNHVHDGVIKLSGDKQHPVMYGNFSDDMPVIVW